MAPQSRPQTGRLPREEAGVRQGAPLTWSQVASQPRPQEGLSPQRLLLEAAGVQPVAPQPRLPAGRSRQSLPCGEASVQDGVHLEVGQTRPQRGVERHTNGCYVEGGLRLAAAIPEVVAQAQRVSDTKTTPKVSRWLASAILDIQGQDRLSTKGSDVQSLLKTLGQDQVVDISKFPSVAAQAVQEIQQGAVQAPPMTVDVLSEQEHQPDDPRAVLGLLHGMGIIPRGIMATICVDNYVCTARHEPNGLPRFWQRTENSTRGMEADTMLEFPLFVPLSRGKAGSPYSVQALLSESLQPVTGRDCSCGDAVRIFKGTTPLPQGSALLLRLDRERAVYIADSDGQGGHMAGGLIRTPIVASPEIELCDGSRFELRAVLNYEGPLATTRRQGGGHYYCDVRSGPEQLTRYDGLQEPRPLDLSAPSETSLFFLYTRMATGSTEPVAGTEPSLRIEIDGEDVHAVVIPEEYSVSTGDDNDHRLGPEAEGHTSQSLEEGEIVSSDPDDAMESPPAQSATFAGPVTRSQTRAMARGSARP